MWLVAPSMRRAQQRMDCPAGSLPGGFDIGQVVWAATDIGEHPVVVHKYVRGMVLGPSTAEDKSRVCVLWDKLIASSQSGCSDVFPRMLSTCCPALPGGLDIGQVVWAAAPVGRVRKYVQGTVVGPSLSDDKARVCVHWEGQAGWDNVSPRMLDTSCPRLPGGFDIGQVVWAATDLGEDPERPIVIHKYVRGTVVGPSTSTDKSRVCVLWEKLITSGQAGCHNVRPEWLSARCPALPGEYTVGQVVWAAQDIGHHPALVHKYWRGMVLGPSTSDDKSLLHVRWEKLFGPGHEGCNSMGTHVVSASSTDAPGAPNVPPHALSSSLTQLARDEEKHVKRGAASCVAEAQAKRARCIEISDDDACTVCMTVAKTHIFVPCGHVCACEGCAASIMQTTKECPLCRTGSSLVVKAFF